MELLFLILNRFVSMALYILSFLVNPSQRYNREKSFVIFARNFLCWCVRWTHELVRMLAYISSESVLSLVNFEHIIVLLSD